MSVSLTELRQRLFQLADRVVETGEPRIVLRHGVRLRLIRDESAVQSGGRRARLKTQKLWVGAPLQPHESPAQWTELSQLQVAEPSPERLYLPARAARSKEK
jgi:antitoxin (DNA-binding transcriptional repressor) of toxin-antitoxin stability system